MVETHFSSIATIVALHQRLTKPFTPHAIA